MNESERIIVGFNARSKWSSQVELLNINPASTTRAIMFRDVTHARVFLSSSSSFSFYSEDR